MRNTFERYFMNVATLQLENDSRAHYACYIGRGINKIKITIKEKTTIYSELTEQF